MSITKVNAHKPVQTAPNQGPDSTAQIIGQECTCRRRKQRD